MSALDQVWCPACVAPTVAVEALRDEEDPEGGAVTWYAVCSTCEYQVADGGAVVRPLTLREMMRGERSGTGTGWADVDLERWTAMVAHQLTGRTHR